MATEGKKFGFTVKRLNDLTPGEKRFDVWDTKSQKLKLRVQPSGIKTFRYYRRNGDITIGRFPEVSPDEARRIAADFYSKEARGEDPRRDKSMTLGEFIRKHYGPWAENNLKPAGYIEQMRVLKVDFGNFWKLPLEEIRPERLARYRNSHKSLSSSTLRRRISVLKAALNRAVDLELIPVNPIGRLKLPSEVKNDAFKPLQPDQKSKLVDTVEARGDYFQWLVPLALKTGMRLNELRQLLWSDIHDGQIEVRATVAKSSKSRMIPISKSVEEILRSIPRVSPHVLHQWLHGHAVPFGDIKKGWRTVRKDSGLQSLRFHDLRHQAASDMINAGVDIYVVAQILGHSTTEVTTRYAHLLPDTKLAALELL